MNRINQKLKRSFHQQFPGTGVIVNADGTQTAMTLLRSGDIDLAAIDRPLNAEEKADNLAAIAINSSNSERQGSTALYYVYREPANIDVEVFLGYMLSPEGQAIIDRL
ncbi:substrate-binding domain-containing protein [Pleurocapsales cyanobacterium LEGE 10410]|nr:substrate-binding domain-containing protein [Pleurocapsales cyanobacterium LEGE 10410]